MCKSLTNRVRGRAPFYSIVTKMVVTNSPIIVSTTSQAEAATTVVAQQRQGNGSFFSSERALQTHNWRLQSRHRQPGDAVMWLWDGRRQQPLSACRAQLDASSQDGWWHVCVWRGTPSTYLHSTVIRLIPYWPCPTFLPRQCAKIPPIACAGGTANLWMDVLRYQNTA